MNLFIKSAGIRAIKMACHTAIAMIGSATVLNGVDWRMLLSATALSGVLSVLTSIATGLPEVEMQNPEYLTVAMQKAERESNGEYIDYTEKPGGLDHE